MTTKTTAPADELADAQKRLEDAREAEAAAEKRCADLRTAILNGEDVSAETLAEAGHDLEYAKVMTEAATLALETATRDARLARLEAIKADALTGTGNADEVAELMTQMETAAARIVAICTERRSAIQRTMRALQKEGVPGLQIKGYTHPTPEHAGMGWKHASMGADDRVIVGDRTITEVRPGELIAVAVARGCNAANVGAGYLAPFVDIRQPSQRLTVNTDGWIREMFSA